MDSEPRGADRADTVDADVVATIELELLKLVRQLETYGRRSSLYVQVDRAGYLAMRMLDCLGPVSTNTLAQALRLDASTVTRQVTALERGGFIERRADRADKRSSSIVLTTEGRRCMHDVQQQRRTGIEALVGDWGTAERSAFGLALARLNASLEQSAAPPGLPRLSPDAAGPGAGPAC